MDVVRTVESEVRELIRRSGLDPSTFSGGKGFGGCHFQITTVNISQYLPGIEDITSVPELAAFKALR